MKDFHGASSLGKADLHPILKGMTHWASDRELIDYVEKIGGDKQGFVLMGHDAQGDQISDLLAQNRNQIVKYAINRLIGKGSDFHNPDLETLLIQYDSNPESRFQLMEKSIECLVSQCMPQEIAEKYVQSLVKDNGTDGFFVGDLASAIGSEQEAPNYIMHLAINLGAHQYIVQDSQAIVAQHTDEGNHWVQATIRFDQRDPFKVDIIYRDPLGKPPHDDFLHDFRNQNEVRIMHTTDKDQNDAYNCSRYTAMYLKYAQDHYGNYDAFNQFALKHFPPQVIAAGNSSTVSQEESVPPTPPILDIPADPVAPIPPVIPPATIDRSSPVVTPEPPVVIPTPAPYLDQVTFASNMNSGLMQSFKKRFIDEKGFLRPQAYSGIGIDFDIKKEGESIYLELNDDPIADSLAEGFGLRQGDKLHIDLERVGDHFKAINQIRNLDFSVISNVETKNGKEIFRDGNFLNNILVKDPERRDFFVATDDDRNSYKKSGLVECQKSLESDKQKARD